VAKIFKAAVNIGSYSYPNNGEFCIKPTVELLFKLKTRIKLFDNNVEINWTILRWYFNCVDSTLYVYKAYVRAVLRAGLDAVEIIILYEDI